QPMLQRYRTLVYDEAKNGGQYRKLDMQKRVIQTEMEGAVTYLKTAKDNLFVKKELEKIAVLRKDLASPSKRREKAVETRSQTIIRLLQQHVHEGLDTDEIMAALHSQEIDIDRNYVTTILYKLYKKGK